MLYRLVVPPVGTYALYEATVVGHDSSPRLGSASGRRRQPPGTRQAVGNKRQPSARPAQPARAHGRGRGGGNLRRARVLDRTRTSDGRRLQTFAARRHPSSAQRRPSTYAPPVYGMECTTLSRPAGYWRGRRQDGGVVHHGDGTFRGSGAAPQERSPRLEASACRAYTSRQPGLLLARLTVGKVVRRTRVVGRQPPLSFFLFFFFRAAGVRRPHRRHRLDPSEHGA